MGRSGAALPRSCVHRLVSTHARGSRIGGGCFSQNVLSLNLSIWCPKTQPSITFQPSRDPIPHNQANPGCETSLLIVTTSRHAPQGSSRVQRTRTASNDCRRRRSNASRGSIRSHIPRLFLRTNYPPPQIIMVTHSKRKRSVADQLSDLLSPTPTTGARCCVSVNGRVAKYGKNMR